MRKVYLQGTVVAVTALYAGLVLMLIGSLTDALLFPELYMGIGQALATAGLVVALVAFNARYQDRRSVSTALPIVHTNDPQFQDIVRNEIAHGRNIRLALARHVSRSPIVSTLVLLIEEGMLRPEDVAIVVQDPKMAGKNSQAVEELIRVLDHNRIPVRFSPEPPLTSVILTERKILLGISFPSDSSSSDTAVRRPPLLEIDRYSELGKSVEDSFAKLWALSNAAK